MSHVRCRLTVATAVTVCLLSPPFGPVRPALAAQGQAGSELAVSLITVGPGSNSWEMFGHNAIRIRDRERGTDISYNYGMFSFQQENFLIRFMQGRMLYWMAGLDTEGMLQVYIGTDRTIWEQELVLTPAERVELRDFLEWNALAENAYYRYDYYYDNCSTRVRDAIDRVIGGALRRQTETVLTETTFRSHTQRLSAGDPLLYTGLLLGLGTPVDRPISAWETMFLPVELMKRIRDVTVTGADGSRVPLVRSEQTLFLSSRPAERDEPPAWLVFYFVAGVVLGGLIIWLSRRVPATVPTRVAFGGAAGLWTLFAGLTGFLLLGLWSLTDHSAAYRNENLFYFSPIALPLAASLFVGIRRGPAMGRVALWLSAALAVSSLVGFVLQVLPGVDQVNGQLVALALPVNVALWAAIRHIVSADS